MAYQLLYHPDVVSDDIPEIPRNLRERIRKAIEERLLVDPIKYGDFLKRDLKGYRKLRVGDYRVIYRLDGDRVIILKIGHRKAVYAKVHLRFGFNHN